MKIVGIKIEKGTLSVSIVEKGMRQAELKDSFHREYTSDAELADILREVSRDWTGARIVSSISGAQFSQRTLVLPFGDRKRVEKALPFELEENVPFSLDEVELDHIVLERPAGEHDKKKETTVLGMMLPKTILRQHLNMLSASGIDPHVVLPTYVGLSLIAKMIPTEGASLMIDGNDLCLKTGAFIAACRSLSSTQATAGIKHTIKALEADHGARIEKAYLLSENESVRAELADLGISVEQVAPDYHGKKATEPVSLGLALAEEINFRKGDFSYRLADVGIRKRRNTLIIAGTIAALIAGANLGAKYYLVESSYGKLDREIKEIYRQTFPDSKTTADPVRQLRTRLDEAKKKFGVLGTGTSALDVMKAVTDGIPKEVRVSFTEFNFEGDLLKLQGEASSFESIDKMKAELQKATQFSTVVVQDTRMGVDNKVKFRFEMKMKQAI